MIVGTGRPTDCNDLKVGSIAYAYSATANSPGTTAGWVIFTFGPSEKYKVQLAILTTSGEIKTRGLSDSGGWTAWV